MYYLNNFFLFSIFGFIIETIINWCLGNDLNSGFLYGPYTPIYGLGVLIIIFINKWLDKKKLNKWLKLICTFIINTLSLTIIELIGGYLIKFIFHKDLWDYSGLNLNIGKYISLEISFVWGIMSLIYIYVIKRISDKLISKIPKWLTYFALIVFIFDFIYTLNVETILNQYVSYH